MAYIVNGIVQTSNALMDAIVASCKVIIDGLVLKNSDLADANEVNIEESDFFMSVTNKSARLSFFPKEYFEKYLKELGYSSETIALYLIDPSNNIPADEQETLLEYCNKRYLEDYEEKNNYFRMLNGLPEYGTTEYNIYVDYETYKDQLLKDTTGTDFDFSAPIHTFTIDQITTLETLGIMDAIYDKYITNNTENKKKYKYLNFLGGKKIDIYKARLAKNWDILYMPPTNRLVADRFQELYKINRDIYDRRVNQIAYSVESDHFTEMLMFMIVCQTFNDMIVDIPEWYIRRDIIDLRSVQYFLESQGVQFFSDIPLKYQVRIVKSLNKLIKYKSTTKNINDILEIFDAGEDSTIYHYYLLKKYKTTKSYYDDIVDPSIRPNPDFIMDDIYEFYNEDNYPDDINDTGKNEYNGQPVVNQIYDFDEIEGDPTIDLYDFGNEDASLVPSSDRTEREQEYEESRKVITDKYNNVYDLEFVKVPINDQYDNYIKNPLYREDYDEVVKQDKYWEGTDVHSLVRNNHLRKDFTIEGSKYIGLEYNVSFEKYNLEREYYLGMIFNNTINMDDIKISVPSLKQNAYFNIRNIFVFLYCCNGLYSDEEIDVNDPTAAMLARTLPKPDFLPYKDIDGGYVWSGDGEVPEPEHHDWEVPNLDFGDEDQTIKVDNDKIEVIYDFGYQNTIDPSEYVYDYDYGEITDGLVFYDEDEDEIIIDPDSEYRYKYDDILSINEYNYTSIIGQFYVNQINGDVTKITVDNCRDYIGQIVTIRYSWHYIKDHGFIDLDADGHRVFDQQENYRLDIDGGQIPYSLTDQSDFYDYIRTKHDYIFKDCTGRVYGFNMDADLEQLAEDIGFNHSAFGFNRGYTLADVGCDTFITRKKFTDLTDMYNVYQNNIKCFETLKDLYENADSRDKKRVYSYVYYSLFTTPYNMEFYTMNNGDIAKTYDQVLEKCDYTLYNKYLSLKNEPDPETRISNIRNIMNDLVDTLNYYISGDNLKYVMSFVYTNSFDAVMHYIQEMINFFKSWKVQFLNPKVNYLLDDKYNHMVTYGDQLSEIKEKYWTTDSNFIGDSVFIKTLYFFEDMRDKTNTNFEAEVVDLAAHYMEVDLLDDKDYDGGGVEEIVGASEDDEYGLDYIDLDGGNFDEVEQSHYITVDGGDINARKNIYDLDGGSPRDYSLGRTFVDIDGGIPEQGEPTKEDWDVDGGFVTVRNYQSRTAITTIDEYNQISVNARLSSYNSNGLELKYSEDAEPPVWPMRNLDFGNEDDDWNNVVDYGDMDDPSDTMETIEDAYGNEDDDINSTENSMVGVDDYFNTKDLVYEYIDTRSTKNVRIYEFGNEDVDTSGTITEDSEEGLLIYDYGEITEDSLDWIDSDSSVSETGLYFNYLKYASKDDMIKEADKALTFKMKSVSYLRDLYDTIMIYSDEDIMNYRINQIFSGIFKDAKFVLDRMDNPYYDDAIEYTMNSKIKSFEEWFWDVNPYRIKKFQEDKYDFYNEDEYPKDVNSTGLSMYNDRYIINEIYDFNEDEEDPTIDIYDFGNEDFSLISNNIEEENIPPIEEAV